MESGGRFTENTSDLTLSYARAQRDLACVYSVGFYDEEPQEDRVKNVTIRMRRAGLRAIHPSKYVFRSREARLEARLRAAFLSPELYATGVVRAHIFPLRPESKKSWKGLLVVNFSVPLAEMTAVETTREFSAVLHTGSEFTHGFDRRITLTAEPGQAIEPQITFLEPVDLEPGAYVLTVVMSDPQGENPHTARIELEVPEIPNSELFLAGPILGKAAGNNVVITGGGSGAGADKVGSPSSFEPVMVQQFDEPVDLVALTEACVVGGEKKLRTVDGYHVAHVDRTLRDASGSAIGELASQGLRSEGDGEVRCENLLDVLPVSALADGEYVFEALLRTSLGETPAETIRFSVGPAEPTSSPSED